MTFAIAAAGTGGHVIPALGVADALIERGVATRDIVFFGGDRLEATAVPDAGFPLVQLDVRGLRRSLSASNLGIPSMLAKAVKTARREMLSRGVKVLAGFGGYVTVPTAWAARRNGIPFVLHEQNAEPGLANRLVARQATAVYCAFEAATSVLPRAQVIGNPLRHDFDSFDRAAQQLAARHEYGLPAEVPVLGVLGGSQGARILNDAVAELVGEARPGEFAVLHLAGSVHADAVASRAVESAVPWVVVGFEDDMASFYAACDLVLSRAGALTISELAATSTPAVVVPYAAGSAHQAANAEDLERAGGAVVIQESDIAAAPGRLRALLADRAALVAMGKAGAGVGRTDAAGVIADKMLEIADAG